MSFLAVPWEVLLAPHDLSLVRRCGPPPRIGKSMLEPSETWNLSDFLHCILYASSWREFSAFKDSGDDTGSTQIIQDGFPISQSTD